MNYEKAVKNIRAELKSYIETNKIKSLVLGVSGGMDSCLCAALAKPVCDELRIPLIGRSLPISTNTPDEIERATLTGKVFCTDFREMNLGSLFDDVFIGTYEDKFKDQDFSEDPKNINIWRGNIKARIRMIYLYNLAARNHGMVLSTDNYTEYMLGFSTIMGDWGDFGMIQYLWKSEVYEMAEWIKNNECKFLNQQSIIELSINALATDGLGVTNRGDLGQILPEFEGSSKEGYKEVDKILQHFIFIKETAALTPKIIKWINKMSSHPVIIRHLNSEFKRNWPITIKRNRILYNI